MLTHYLKIAFRHLRERKLLSLIKIIGLSIGLMVCILIVLYTKDEFSYDRFHEKQSRLYRVVQTMKIGGDAPRNLGVTVPPLAPAIQNEIPEVTEFVRTHQEMVTVKNKNEVFIENTLVSDSNFFSVFSFPLLKGNPATALNNIHSIILSEDFAKKYFGTADAINKIMELKVKDSFEVFQVTAIARNCPQNSTIRFDMLMPYAYYLKNTKQDDDWVGGNVNTFLLVNPNTDTRRTEQKIQTLFDEHTRPQLETLKKDKNVAIKISLALEPLQNIHFGAFGQDNGLDKGSSKTYSYILGIIAIFILVVACINFINLSIAQSLKRSKEIGIRKVTGSTRIQLIRQLLIESFVISSLSFLIAVVLAWLLLPLFNEMTNKKLSLFYLFDYKLYTIYFSLLLGTSLIAGFYPSFILSSFKPVKALSGRQTLMGKNYFTRGLIILQFALAVFLTITTIIIYKQLNFLNHSNLGYDPKNLVKIDMPPGNMNGKPFELFKNDLAGNPVITSIAGRNRGTNTTSIRTPGKDITIDYNKINEDFFPELKITFKQGRNFDPSLSSDASQSAIVNESFLKEAGWQDAIGKTVTFRSNKKQLTIVGVISDYNFKSLKEKVSPQLFTLDTSMNYGQAWVKIGGKDIPATMEQLRQSYKKISPYFPFNYQFVSDSIAKNYEEEAKWKKVIGVSCILFIVIACIGLLGLVALAIEQRIKEIGIRKVLGAAVSQIILIICREFISLIGIAFLIALPVGYYIGYKWLQGYAYRTDINWWIFVLAGLIVLAIALITLSFQAIKAAIANPVKSLRTE